MAAFPSSAAPTPAAPATPTRAQPSTLHLPSPQIFDILPPLHEILARIEHDGTSTESLLNAAGNDLVGARYADSQPLDPKDLPNEVLALKARIRKALKELEKLPDMHRTRQEQVEQMAELEQRQKDQEALMARLAEVAVAMQERIANAT